MKKLLHDVNQARPLGALFLGALSLRALFLGTLLAGFRPGLASAAEALDLPVKEVTVFKDGHAFVLREGEAAVDGEGRVVLEGLPRPVLGTFWPYSAEGEARLESVVAGTDEVKVRRPARDLRELLESAVGGELMVAEASGERYRATLLEAPWKALDGPRAAAGEPGEAPAATSAPRPAADYVLLRTTEGVKPVSLAAIRDVTFLGSRTSEVEVEETRTRLTLNLARQGGGPGKARVGMVYLEKGLRWIPEYHVALDGKGQARVKLQATLVNDLRDLEGVTVHLVVGVPSFLFKDQLDPVALGGPSPLEGTAAQLTPHYGSRYSTPFAFSNAIQTQMAGVFERRSRGSPEGPEPDPAAPDPGSRAEDLYVFTVEGIRLRRGERMVLPVAECQLPYEDLFTVELPFAPPLELRRHLASEGRADLARLLAAPRAIHKIRLRNTGKAPLTTAPALLFREGTLLAQGLMTYASPGSSADLEVTTAVDLKVRRRESEAERRLNALRLNGHDYHTVHLEGALTLRNLRQVPVEVEVKRHVLGNVDRAGAEASIEKANALEDLEAYPLGTVPGWWWHCSWPEWWSRLNGVGVITWRVRLEPGASVELPYAWHYYWS